MFDRIVFFAEWAILEDRFGGKRNPETALRYFDILAEALTEDELRAGCAHVFRHAQFFPSPQAIIDGARGDQRAHALTVWGQLLQRAASGEQITQPGSIERRVLNAATNGVPLGQVETKQLDFIKREFVASYVAALVEAAPRALPAPNRELTNAN